MIQEREKCLTKFVFQNQVMIYSLWILWYIEGNYFEGLDLDLEEGKLDALLLMKFNFF